MYGSGAYGQLVWGGAPVGEEAEAEVVATPSSRTYIVPASDRTYVVEA